jgi:hypothetical protein
MVNFTHHNFLPFFVDKGFATTLAGKNKSHEEF